ncbi:hypothetical protein E3T43_12780 [Cryobacterium sp. Hh7]|uniref:hypothetical protein n=1 Tax=Cryobacterium sp. Hh7 TaxID=1259159 RepID=UPI00106C0775|nr:hypothetical protein [Cryobacterium sp. Hh7]TFD54396.1 hypothetical protein E3T43_12780 [Cryobacterium sp. Hh7]
MEIIFFVFLVGLVLMALYALVLVFCAILGIPLESKEKVARRQQIAEDMRQQSIEDETRRNIAVRAAEQGMSV